MTVSASCEPDSLSQVRLVQMFGQRKRLRRLAAHMLLVWLFALASGIVNACVVEPELRHAALAAAQDHHAAAQANQHDPAMAAAAHEHQAPHAAKYPCAKLCDVESVSAPTVKPQADPLNAAWLAPLLVRSLVVHTALVPAGVFDSRHGQLPARIPISIAFLRLTL